MSTHDEHAIYEAEEVIERFGGIRPMASKIDVPVTTVQGWKKRNIIPGTRRTLIIEAAKANNIDLSDIIRPASNVVKSAAPDTVAPDTVANENKAANEKAEPSEETKILQPVSENKAKQKKEEQPAPQKQKQSIDRDTIIAQMQHYSQKAVQSSIWATTVLLVIVIAGAAYFLWPVLEKTERNSMQLAALESRMDTLNEDLSQAEEKTGFLDRFVPEDLEGKYTALQNQAANIENTFEQLKEKTSDVSQTVLEETGSAFAERLQALEQNVGEPLQFQDSIAELRTIVDSMEGEISSLNSKLQDVKIPGSELGETISGVPQNDLKAAAMLLAFSQLRDTLNRQGPVEEDLALFRNMIGNDNPELVDALNRLTPHAKKGILTPQGLSQEFRGLAGDLVVASLSGEDISVSERARARFGDILKVEKDGELLSGTETQGTVAKAQVMLDEGDVRGAIGVLEQLSGEAARKAQPFIERAQTTLAADRIQTMIRQMILNNVSGVFSSDSNMDVSNEANSLEGVIPDQNREVPSDDAGNAVLPQSQKFKGFSSGQP